MPELIRTTEDQSPYPGFFKVIVYVPGASRDNRCGVGPETLPLMDIVAFGSLETNKAPVRTKPVRKPVKL